MWGKREPDPVRQEASGKIAEASSELRRLWQHLAEAGCPRVSKTVRAQALADATDRFDRARSAAAEASRKVALLVLRVEGTAEERADRLFASREPEAHDRAAVTQLRPQLSALRSELEHVRVCLLAYCNKRLRRQFDGLEATAARKRSLFFDTPPSVICCWCGVAEQAHQLHYSLDGHGLLTDRREARRFCCHRCFLDGNDLCVPDPVVPAVKPAASVLVTTSTPEETEPEREDRAPRAEKKSGPTLEARAAAV